MPWPPDLPIALVIVIFLAAATVIAIAGTRLARIADELAVRTRLGEAIMGALFLGASTSLPGVVTSVVTAAHGHVSLATGNALGGIAVQTAFLCVADITYRKANLEHAAASVANLVQGTLLIALLAIPLIAASLPSVAVYGVSPFSVILFASYVFGMRLLGAAGDNPMWRPQRTRDTQREELEEPGKVAGSTVGLWGRFMVLAVVLGAMGYMVSQTGIALTALTGLSETAVGALFTAVATSLPELVISVAAVRRGALNLAVGNIIGGNCFDVLFLAGADVAYRDGSLYGHFVARDVFLLSATILMISVLLLGLLHRERRGFAGIGFESALVLVIYIAVIATVTF